MKIFQITLALAITTFLCANAMDRTIARSRSMENIHSAEENKSAAQNARTEQLRLTLSNKAPIPAAPAFKPAAKQLTPPAPEKRAKTFLQRNRKAIVIGGIGTGLVAGGLLWKLLSKEAPAPKNWFEEESL